MKYSVISKEFSLADFISENKDIIDKTAPRNPSISKDDEWRDPFYDSFYRSKIDK